MNKKQAGLVVVLVSFGFLLSNILPALACGGGPSLLGFDDPQAPKAIVLAAFSNLSQKLNTNLDPSVIPWLWNEDIFANTGLDCPAAGKVADKTLTRGYRVTISVMNTNGAYTDYFFNATKDGTTLFQCTNAGPGPLIPVSA